MSKQDIAAKALNYVAVTSALTKRALDEIEIHRQVAEKAAGMRGEVLDTLLKSGCVNESQKVAADTMLGSHDTTLGLLKMAAETIQKLQSQVVKQATDLGTGVPDLAANSQGSYDSLTSPFVGRKTSEKKASDVAILKLLN